MILVRPGLRGVLPAALMLLGMSAITATAQPRVLVPGAPLPFDPTVRRGTLGNGLEFYIRGNTEPRNRAQLWLALHAGSVLEDDDQRGMARFVAHMAFRGTSRFSPREISDFLQAIGSRPAPGQHVHTGHDMTVFHLEIPTGNSATIDTGIEMLSEWAYAIAFTPDQTAQERTLMLDRWGSDDDATSIRDRQLPVLLGDSRYSERLPSGRREVIESASPELLRVFYDRWYRPDLMAVVAVGDFDPEVIEAAVRRHFAPPPEGTARHARARHAVLGPRPTFAVPDHSEPRVSVVTDPDANETRIALYRKLRADTSADLAAYRHRLTQKLVSGMLNTRLSERQEADVSLVSAAAGRSRLVGETDTVIVIALVVQDEIEHGLQALLDELRGVRDRGFTTAEMEREKAALMRTIDAAHEQRDRRPSQQLADQYLRHFLAGQPVPGSERERDLHRLLLPEIPLVEINHLARLSLPSGDTDNTVLLVSGPETILAASPGGDAATEAVLAARLREQLATGTVPPAADDSGGGDSHTGLLTSVPSPGLISAEKRLEAIDARQWTLSNGVTVIAKQTAPDGDEVLFHASSPGGTSLVEDADFVPALTAAALIANSGAGAHDGAALEQLLAGKNVTVTPYIAELFEGFTGRSTAQELDTLVQLVYLYATQPRVDSRFYAAYAAHLARQAEQRAGQPAATLSDTLRIVLSRNHFRARPVTPELVEELDLERAVAVYADRFADFGDFTFLFVGAFDWQRLRMLTETYLANLPVGARQEQWRDVEIDPPAGMEDHAVHGGSEGRSTTRLVFAGAMEWSRSEVLALTALGEVLELRLRERLQNGAGVVVGIGVDSDTQFLPDPEYRLIVGFDSDPQRADEARDAVFAELAWLREGGEQRYLDAAKETLHAARAERSGHNRFWITEILAAVRRNEPFSEIGRFAEHLDALTPEQLAAAAHRYLTPDRYIRVVLLPQ